VRGVTHVTHGDADFTFSPYKRGIGKKPKTGSHLSPVSRQREGRATARPLIPTDVTMQTPRRE